jgi:CHASE1-domain containing sensor protein
MWDTVIICFEVSHPMKPFTEKQKQWLWFVALCLGGLSATFALAAIVRCVVSIR